MSMNDVKVYHIVNGDVNIILFLHLNIEDKLYMDR